MQNIRITIQKIVEESNRLKNKHTTETKAPVNYVCIFCQTENEFEEFKKEAEKLGEIIKQTPTGPLFKISINTTSGRLRLLKIRAPDETRKERGDADFTVSNYKSFKEEYLKKERFSLVKRENFEMIELVDPDFNVRTYFSNPPLDQQLNLI